MFTAFVCLWFRRLGKSDAIKLSTNLEKEIPLVLFKPSDIFNKVKRSNQLLADLGRHNVDTRTSTGTASTYYDHGLIDLSGWFLSTVVYRLRYRGPSCGRSQRRGRQSFADGHRGRPPPSYFRAKMIGFLVWGRFLDRIVRPPCLTSSCSWRMDVCLQRSGQHTAFTAAAQTLLLLLNAKRRRISSESRQMLLKKS